MWDLPRPGLEPVSPALAGRFLTTAPPGKPQTDTLMSTLRGCKIILTIICAYGNKDIYPYMRQREVQNITLDIAAPNESNHEEI